MSNYLIEFEAQTMFTLKQGKIEEKKYMVCSSCSRLADTEQMTHTERSSVCNRCIQNDLDYLDGIGHRG